MKTTSSTHTPKKISPIVIITVFKLTESPAAAGKNNAYSDDKKAALDRKIIK
jgi:hypothetical protein